MACIFDFEAASFHHPQNRSGFVLNKNSSDLLRHAFATDCRLFRSKVIRIGCDFLHFFIDFFIDCRVDVIATLPHGDSFFFQQFGIRIVFQLWILFEILIKQNFCCPFFDFHHKIRIFLECFRRWFGKMGFNIISKCLIILLFVNFSVFEHSTKNDFLSFLSEF
ncbi:hypothetical protein D1872_120980 [compost metagenome]